MRLEAARMMAQRWDATGYARSGRFVAELAEPLVALLAPQAGEHVLDLGCGDGVLSAEIRDTGATVVAVDASPEMVAAACKHGIDARVMRGEALMFTRAFDAVFSNAALHWMSDLGAVFTGVARALKPGGRFVAEMGGEGNIAKVVAILDEALGRRGLSIPSPWTFPSTETAATLLSRAGFRIDTVELIERPTRLPGDLADWLETFAGDHLDCVPDAERGDLVQEVQAALRPVLCLDGRWTLDYVRLRFAARLPQRRVDAEASPWPA